MELSRNNIAALLGVLILLVGCNIPQKEFSDSDTSIEIKNSIIDSVLIKVYNENRSFLPHKSAIFINIQETINFGIELRVGTLDTSHIQDYISVSVPLFGYYIFKESKVFVFGKKAELFFKKTQDGSFFNTLTYNKKISHSSIVFREFADVYVYQSDRFKFVKRVQGIAGKHGDKADIKYFDPKLCTLNKLELKQSNINSLISEMYKALKDGYNPVDRILVMNIGAPTNSELQARMSVFSRTSFSGYLRDQKDKPFGFYVYRSDTVLIFGGRVTTFFAKLPETKCFDFLYLEPKIVGNNGITPPPQIFEPIIWVFEYEKGMFVLRKKACLGF